MLRLVVDERTAVELTVVEADGVVCDLDGVLVDSAASWRIAEDVAIRQLGGEIPATRSGMAGLAPDAAGALLAERSRLAGRADELQRTVEAVAVDVFGRTVDAVDGAAEFLAALRAVRPVVVATNSPGDIARASLASAGLSELVDVLVAVDEVGVGKPDPALYLEACRRAGFDPTRTVGIEDSATGYRALLAAGLHPIAFGEVDLTGLAPPLARVDAWAKVRVAAG